METMIKSLILCKNILLYL